MFAPRQRRSEKNEIDQRAWVTAGVRITTAEGCRMLRDIVVHIPVEQSAQPVIDCAVSIGSIFDAHIDGIACVYPTFDPLMAFEASAANVAALTAATQSNTDKAASALDQFEIAARRIGISHGARCISNITYATSLLTEISRLYDLSIVAQPDYSKPNRDALPEALLFDSGRPILMVPYIHGGPLKLQRILICWDGGRPAARAVHDAMPFLHKAKAIDIVSVNEDSGHVGGASSEALQNSPRPTRPVCRGSADYRRRCKYLQCYFVARCRQKHRFNCDGRLWSLKVSGIRPGRSYAWHIRNPHGPGVDLALKLCRRRSSRLPGSSLVRS